MIEAFASGLIVDVAIGLSLIEAALVVLYRRHTGRGPETAEFLINMASGLFLMLALRAALVAAWWGWIAFFLTAAGAAHLTDLRRRWKN